VSLVNAEGEAANAAAVQDDEAGKDAGVEVLEEKLGGGTVVPVKTLVPDFGLLFEERTKLLRGKVAEVEDLELLRGRHEGCQIPVAGCQERLVL
jgi:hypothetical protein